MGWESDAGFVAGPNIAKDMERAAVEKYGRPSEEGDRIAFDGRVFHRTRRELVPAVMGVDMACERGVHTDKTLLEAMGLEDDPMYMSSEEIQDIAKAAQEDVESCDNERKMDDAALILSGLVQSRKDNFGERQGLVREACDWSQVLSSEFKRRGWL